MKTIKIISMLILIVLLGFSFNRHNRKSAAIKGNQLGYYPGSNKIAVIANSEDSLFTIKDENGALVYHAALSEQVLYEKSGEIVRLANFTNLKKTGKYSLSVKDADQAFIFEIKDNLYNEAFKATLKSYYFQRSGIVIEDKYAGKWKRNLGHPDSICFFHPSSMRGTGSLSSSKGWYDAGDYNKYIVNAGVTVGTLLNFYEMYPNFVTDGMILIPESGNGVSDLLDEIKFEMDWVLTMQTPDGASNQKLTSKLFNKFEMPDNDTSARYFVGKSTAATLNLAAMTAQFARVYKNIDANYAAICLNASEKAWKWAIQNPNLPFKNPEDIKTGEYGDENFTEEFWWAACELYLSTKKPEFLAYASKYEPYIKMNEGDSWSAFIGNLGSFSLLMASDIPSELRNKIQKNIINLADGLQRKMEKNPYHNPIEKFYWGSNGDVLNSAMVLAYAYKISGNAGYLNGVIECSDYILGKNPTAYSFITGFGNHSPMHIHHRVSGADNIDEPIPGLLVGGPNEYRNDKTNNVNYTDTFPAMCYMDIEASYASNEVAINWNAPLVFVLGFLEANIDKLK